MGLIVTLIIGLVVGVVAKVLVPGKDPGGWFVTALLGVLGSFVAGFLGKAVGWYSPDEPAGFFSSVIGAIIVLVVYKIITRQRAVTS